MKEKLPPDLKSELLQVAFTHTSYAHEHPGAEDNERLEFLGDAVLELVVSEALYRRYPGLSEGELTARRAAVVCEDSLAATARELGLGPRLRLGRGEAGSGGGERPSILASALEAVLGAVYLDCGLDRCRELVEDWFGRVLDGDDEPDNPKARLQELVQRRPGLSLEYRVLESTGPPHAPVFEVGVYVGGELVARGSGPSKRSAEKEAARAGLELLDRLDREPPQHP